jgi:hypothetical protein
MFERNVCSRGKFLRESEGPFDEHEKRIVEIPRKENPRIPLDMGRDTNAGRAGRGGNSGRGGRGRGGRGRGANATMPRKASEVGACKELEGHIFTIGSGNKGKDGDMLRTSMEKMTTYIGTKFGDEAAQEWISGKKIVPTEPTYSQAIKDRHAARVKATKDRVKLRLRGLTTEKTAIQAVVNRNF